MPTSTAGTSTVQRAGSVVSAAAVASAVLALVVTEIAPTGVSPVRGAVSEWALTPYEWGYRWFTLSLTVAALALLVAAIATFGRRGGRGIAIALAFVAFGRSFVGWVPMDAPGAAATTTGRVHFALGAISFVAFVVAAVLVARTLRRCVAADGLRLFSLVVAVLAAIFLIGIAAGPASVFGLVERAFYGCLLVWLAVLAAAGVRQGFAAQVS